MHKQVVRISDNRVVCVYSVMMVLATWFAATLAVEAVVEILVSSDILLGVRAWVSRRGQLLSKLVSCGYCMSVWVAVPLALYLPSLDVGPPAMSVVVRIFVLHRLSNVLHELLSRWFQRHPWHVVLENSGQDDGLLMPDGGTDV